MDSGTVSKETCWCNQAASCFIQAAISVSGSCESILRLASSPSFGNLSGFVVTQVCSHGLSWKAMSKSFTGKCWSRSESCDVAKRTGPSCEATPPEVVTSSSLQSQVPNVICSLGGAGPIDVNFGSTQ